MSILDAYELKKVLERDSLCTCILAESKETGEECVIKIYTKDVHNVSRQVHTLKVEKKDLRKLSHPNIIQVKDIMQNVDHIFYVEEYMAGGSLFEKLREVDGFNEYNAVHIVTNICSAIEYIHNLGILHKNLRPNALFLKNADDLTVKVWITDKDDYAQKSSLFRDPMYVAPEALEGKSLREYTDMWNLGVISYTLICGFTPFYHESVHDLLELILKGDFTYPPKNWDGVSENAKDFINNLIVLDPTKRLTAKEALKHPWIQAVKTSRVKSARK